MSDVGLVELGALFEVESARAVGLTAAGAAIVASRASGPVVVVTPDDASAQAIASDASLFTSELAAFVPSNPTEPYAELSADTIALGERLAALHQIRAGTPKIVAASVRSLLRRVVSPFAFAELSRTVRAGEELERDELAAFLVGAGYRRIPVVDDPGAFALRGDIVDVFPPASRYPIRIELFGDEVEALRRFDPMTQRTLRTEPEVEIHPCREVIRTGNADVRARLYQAADRASHPSRETRLLYERIDRGEEFVGVEIYTPAFHDMLVPLWSYFDPQAVVIVLDPDAIAMRATDFLAECERRHSQRLDDHKISFPPSDHFVSVGQLGEFTASAKRVLTCPRLDVEGESGGELPTVRLAVTENRELARALEHARKGENPTGPLVQMLSKARADGTRVALVSGSDGRTVRLSGILEAGGLAATTRELPIDLEAEAPIAIYRGVASAGINSQRDDFTLITDDDIFGERRSTSTSQKRAAARAKSALLGAVSDFSQLGEGDFLVHQVHGVGRYRGLAKLPVGATEIDFLNVEYTGGILYLPVFRIGEVQRYVGAEGQKPRIDKLGGTSWAKKKTRVGRDVAALAEALLQLYAQRAALSGRAFPIADAMFRDFEATFEFEETPDQAAAISAVLGDMERSRPMDRLVCGDVGYGKTEVALRAILKSTLGGAQAAMLAPTTVLVEQHFQTMKTRFADWPVTIGKLSRFQKRPQQLATIRGLADGSIDAVVGTHRLLSKDVRFKDLGLAVVDEEQRFGVVHKERLKKLRTQIDVLTLTATPIPRTLHLAMAGLRDLSIIATPPADRRSIRTFVARAEDGVLREGIRRELGRGGQIFFVVPRIEQAISHRSLGLREWAEKLAELVPEARISQAHGQMSADELEKSMVGFVAGESDVLVSTTIVESGLDISRANTMFIADADRFGLAQLYQLRGRIGRSKERAYCYLMIPASHGITDGAMRRLETLQRFTELGAGFMIASQDLEIRGAGELLGSKQSGTIAAVGFDAYTLMLEEAVAELRGEPITRASDPELSVEVPGYIPDDYVPDTGQRLTLYKRLSSAGGDDEVAELLEEIGDRYGPVPGEVVLLAELMAVKAMARRLCATAIDINSKRITLTLGEETTLDPIKLAELIASDPSWRMTPDSRVQVRLSADESASPTEAAKRRLSALSACANSDH